jgi:hydroxymethylpyrimidine/phosphomethylpyrimidine kinase
MTAGSAGVATEPRQRRRPRALTIAGSDSGAGAGIQADLKTFAAHGVYGTTAITAVTAQNTRGVTLFEPVSPELVTAQIEAVMSDIGADAVKTGMLANAAIVTAVAAAIAKHGIRLLVVDPVMVAKSGDRLLDEAALAALKTQLLPLAFAVTPNIPEAEALAGMAIGSADDRREAARRIAAMGPPSVIIKGGHAPSDDIVDLLFEKSEFVEFRHNRVRGRHTHGTGCTFSAALAAHLALGRSLREAIPLSQQYIAGAIGRAPDIGSGHGPMEHF